MWPLTRRKRISVGVFDAGTNRWTDVDPGGSVDRVELTVATFNIWFDAYFAEQRYQAIAELLSRDLPDLVVLQEVTPSALETLLSHPRIRANYRRAAAVGDDFGNYGMLMLSRLPLTRVTYTRLPTKQSRGLLCAELTINGAAQVICSVHLDSGKAAARLRARQLRRAFRALGHVDSAVLLGDFNMRDAENPNIVAPYRDVWPALRPNDDGFTEDTSVNLMRLDSKNKTRQVRFDRILLKGSAWAATAIDLLGTEPISASQPRVFPSDHFGVRCRLVRGPTEAAVPGRRRAWRRNRLP